MFGIANDEKPIKKALMTSLSAAITSQGSVNINFVTIMVDSGALGHHFNDAIIRDLKHCLQNYVHLATLREGLSAGRAMLDGTVESVLQVLVTDDYGNQILVRVDLVVVPRIGRNLFSVSTAAKTSFMTISDCEKPRLEGINVTVPLRSESGDPCSFVRDFSADGYATKDLAINAVANAQVWHRWMGHLHAPSLEAASPAKSLPEAAGEASSRGASPPSGGGASPKIG